MSRTDKDTSIPALPGMNTFVLSTPSSPSTESETSEPLSPVCTKHAPPMHALDNYIADFWQHDATELDTFHFDALLQRPASADIERGGTTASGKTSEAFVNPKAARLA
ncbi:MAG: hypothetical protein LQ352_002118 [Teloschistes flavicans]|nr:MAG: hypothetical protein LQ352_002118 [Teloschistes flavicans]